MRTPAVSRLHPAALLALLLLVLATAACDDPTKLSPGEQRIAVGAEATGLCWSQEEDGLARTRAIATVFGEDGSVAEGTTVQFTVDWPGATLDPVEIGTDETGRAIVEVATTRPDGDQLTITGALPDGASDDVTISVPPPPVLQFVPDNPRPAIGEEFFVHVYVVGPCDLNSITFRLEWDPAVLEYLPGEWEETGILNAPVGDGSGDGTGDATGDATDDSGDGTGDTLPTEVLESAGPGSVDITYRRVDSPPTGSSATGTYLKLHFRAVGAGDAAMTAPRVELAPPDGRPYELMTSDYWMVIGVEAVEPDGDGSA